MIDWTSIIGFSVAAFFGLLSIYFYFRPRATKIPLYSKRSVNVIGVLPTTFPKLKAIYNNDPIPCLTVTKLAFWNAGSGTIDRGDNPSGDRLRVQVAKPYKILDGRILSQVNPEGNQFSELSRSVETDWPFQFEYIDRGEGFAVEILHTAPTGDSLKVVGSIKGGAHPKRFEDTASAKLVPNLPLFSFFFSLIVLLAIFSILPKLSGNWATLEVIAEFGVLIGGYALAVRFTRRWRGIPKELMVIEGKP